MADRDAGQNWPNYIAERRFNAPFPKNSRSFRQIHPPKSQISNLKSQISNLKSQISNLKSQISNPPLASRRHAVCTSDEAKVTVQLLEIFAHDPEPPAKAAMRTAGNTSYPNAILEQKKYAFVGFPEKSPRLTQSELSVKRPDGLAR